MPQSSHYHRGRINDPGLVYNVRRQGLGPPLQAGGGLMGQPKPQPQAARGRISTASSYRSRSTSDNNRIMSRSATSSSGGGHYASPTMASRSHQVSARSLSRSHEETKVVHPARSPSKNNGLLRPPNSPSRNALAASITSISQQVKSLVIRNDDGIPDFQIVVNFPKSVSYMPSSEYYCTLHLSCTRIAEQDMILRSQSACICKV